MAVALAAACPFASEDGMGLLLGLAPLEGAGVRCIDLGTRDSWVRAFPLLKFEIKIFLAKELTNDFAHLSQKFWKFFLIIKSVDEVAVTTLDILYFYHFFRTTEPISIKNSMRNPSVKVFTIYFFQIKESKGANVHILKLLKTSWNISQKLL